MREPKIRRALLVALIATVVPAMASAATDGDERPRFAPAGAGATVEAEGIDRTLRATVAALERQNAGLQKRVSALEALTHRLHGGKAAVFDRTRSASHSGMPGYFVSILEFCELDGVTDCLRLESDPIEEGDSGRILRFDAASDPTVFPVVAKRLTDGENGLVASITTYTRPDGSTGYGTNARSEYGWFFLEPQTSNGPAYVDLEGLEIDAIEISIDRLNMYYDVDTNRSEVFLEYRVFFMLAK